MKDPYDHDDAQLQALLDAMEGYDANHLAPKQAAAPGAMTVELTIHPHGKSAEAPKEEEKPELTEDEAMLPTPEELEEMMKGLS